MLYCFGLGACYTHLRRSFDTRAPADGFFCTRTRSTAGWLSATWSSASAIPFGSRLPCSQARTVSGLVFSTWTNTC